LSRTWQREIYGTAASLLFPQQGCVHGTHSLAGTSHAAPPAPCAPHAIAEFKDSPFGYTPLNNTFAFPGILESRKHQLGEE